MENQLVNLIIDLIKKINSDEIDADKITIVINDITVPFTSKMQLKIIHESLYLYLDNNRNIFSITLSKIKSFNAYQYVAPVINNYVSFSIQELINWKLGE